MNQTTHIFTAASPCLMGKFKNNILTILNFEISGGVVLNFIFDFENG